jgi:ribose transport system substrate-binding protein
MRDIAGGVAVVVASSIALAACGDDQESRSSSDTKTIGVVLKSLETPYWQSVQSGAEAADEQLDDVEVTIDAAAGETDAVEQTAKIENMLTRGVDALVVAPTLSDEIRPVLQRAIDEGVPVVTVDAPVADLDAPFVGTDNIAGGELAGEYIVEELGGAGEVALFELAGDPSVADRLSGALEAIDASDLEVVQTVNTDCEAEKALAATEDVLTAHPGVGAIFAACGVPAEVAPKAIANAGIAPEDIVLVGFDATDIELEQIKQGTQDASVAQFPEAMGEEGVRAAARMVDGKDVPEFIDSGSELVTADNVAEFLK